MSGDKLNLEILIFSLFINRLEMKTVLVIGSLVIIVLTLSHTKIEIQEPANANEIISEPGSLGFKTIIQTILQKNCSPCHFPGGKIYAAMPFDKAESIIRHEVGVLKRFKNNKKENNMVTAFLEKNKLH